MHSEVGTGERPTCSEFASLAEKAKQSGKEGRGDRRALGFFLFSFFFKGDLSLTATGH